MVGEYVAILRCRVNLARRAKTAFHPLDFSDRAVEHEFAGNAELFHRALH